MSYKIGDKIKIKELFTLYDGVIVKKANGFYTVEANGHSHFMLTDDDLNKWNK